MVGRISLKDSFFIAILLFLLFPIGSAAITEASSDVFETTSKMSPIRENQAGTGSGKVVQNPAKTTEIGEVIAATQLPQLSESQMQTNSAQHDVATHTYEKKIALVLSMLALFLYVNLLYFYASKKGHTIGSATGILQDQKANSVLENRPKHFSPVVQNNITQKKMSAPPPAPLLRNKAIVPEYTSAAQDTAVQHTSANETSFAKKMLELVNQHRAKYGLGPLKLDPLLMRSADIKSKDMLKNKQMSHYSPSLGSPLEQMRAAGINGGVAENVAVNTYTSDPNVIFEMWKNSPGHNANLLLPKAKVMGIGQAGPYFAQQFQF